MTSISKEILDKYQMRKTRAQKSAFISFLQNQYPEIILQEGGLAKNRNLILGDVAKADILLTAHYDTCSVLPFPNFITPKNFLLYIGYVLLILLPFFAAMALCSAVLRIFTDDFWTHYFVTLSLYFLLLFTLLGGRPNKHTANDNTSGVITLCEIYAQLTDQEKQHVCIVFFDNEESGLLGSKFFQKRYKSLIGSKLLINFDCVSDGDNILISASKGARKKWDLQPYFTCEGDKKPLHEKAEKVFYPSDQNGFPNAVAVAALRYNKFLGYYMSRIHTSRDTVFDERNICYLSKNTCALIADICNAQPSETISQTHS